MVGILTLVVGGGVTNLIPALTLVVGILTLVASEGKSLIHGHNPRGTSAGSWLRGGSAQMSCACPDRTRDVLEA